MAKRQKYVHTPDMVAHLWAHQSQEAARTAGSGRLYFEGDTIYSYGSHFPIARHIKKGSKRAVFFTTRSYSMTTAGHKNCVYGACSHLTTFHVHDIYGGHKVHLAEYKQRLANLQADYAKARGRKPEYLNLMEQAVAQANEYAAFFGLKTRFSLPENEKEMREECARVTVRNAEIAEIRRVRNEKEWEAARIQREKEAAKWAVKNEKLLRAWVDGESNELPRNMPWDAPVRLRIAGEELQTTKGAAVPLDHAIRAFRVIQRLYERGETYQRNGYTIHLGHFALDSIEADGTIVAGCHRIARAEVERIAKLAESAGLLKSA